MAEALEDGLADLAIGPFPELINTRLRHRRLFRRGFSCVASDRHPRIQDLGLTMNTFLAEPHLVVRSPGRTQEVFEAFLAERGLQRRIVATVPHMLCVPAVTKRTDLIATVPQSVGEFFGGYPGISVYPVPFSEPTAPPSTTVSQHWSSRFDNDPANAWLRSLVVDLFAEPDAATGVGH
jgi:DNA-binding transcriptional LysR family regulator